MKLYLTRLFAILGVNTLVAIILAVGSMAISVHFGWMMDFPLTIIGIAVVFPIVFSISGAYGRREAALTQYGIMKSNGRSIILASRDWLRDTNAYSKATHVLIRQQITNIFTLSAHLFKSTTDDSFSDEEKQIYQEISKLSQSIERLRETNLSGGEMGRLHGYLNSFSTAFETLKHIYQYRTPRTLRLYSKFFIYVTLVVLGPYFALLADGQNLWLSYTIPVLFAMVLTGLDNIQEHLENPFDQIGEDDIRIHPEKFLHTTIT
jgi:predicted membrane chloride channel (bestrophin family)